MQSIPVFLISQAFSYSMLSHLMFNLMLSVPVPRLENPSNTHIMRYLKFFLDTDFTLHIQGRIPVLPEHAHTAVALLAASRLRGVTSPEPAPRIQPASPPTTRSSFPLLSPLLVWKGTRFLSPRPAVQSRLSPNLLPPRAAHWSQHTHTVLLPLERILLSTYSSE